MTQILTMHVLKVKENVLSTWHAVEKNKSLIKTLSMFEDVLKNPIE
jgi:hypothetical protein